MKSYYTIPIFIPEEACPFRCSYCNQYNIADKTASPHPSEVKLQIEQYLQTFPENGHKKIGFFGGSFTGMTIDQQNSYLDIAQPYIQKGVIHTIQLSTRPDYINEEILINLKRRHVSIIELGAQSLDEDVLRNSRRGHSVEDVHQAAKLIKQHGFQLGLQMMIGLPGDTFEKSLHTAQTFINLNTDYTRIYPTLVIKETDLEKRYRSGEYQPLSLNEAVQWSKSLMRLFERHNVTILRLGLHPSEGLLTGKNLVAGPFHVSFKELVLSEIWKDILNEKTEHITAKHLRIFIPEKAINAAIGYQASNRKWLQEKFTEVTFMTDHQLSDCQCNIEVVC
ncbi:radical SAM protein [Bacteroidales bacterium OttesenSCG-928-B11]|nr:radical SAM protein [Bacteroidales bacterium OttesenSCG-928-B11]MDL2325728.1 radical SAM protein [Bacteroidales bacterium OttesenSCG-928-A14]